MSYCTVAQFKAYAFPSGSYNSIPDATIQYNLDVACSEINAALLPYHTLPLSTASYGITSDLAVIYNAEIVMASYRLMTFTGFKPNANEANDSVLERRYNEITHPDFGLLKRLSKGEFLLFKEADATIAQEKRPRVYGNSGRSTRLVNSEGDEFV